MIDLHLHSDLSDGRLSPEAIAEAAVAGGLSALALTDHDELRGIARLEAAAAGRLEIIPGVEVSSRVDGVGVHILGYGVDPSHSDLTALLAETRAAKRAQVRDMVGRIRGLGIGLTWEDVSAGRGEDAYVGRGHIAQAMVPRFARQMGTVFRRFIGRRGSCYVEARLREGPEVIEAIHAAGGLAVLAHPRMDDLYGPLKTLAAAGLDGLERDRPKGSRQLRQAITSAAFYGDLVLTGGSDWHGAERDGELGDFGLAREDLARFFARLEAGRGAA